MKLRNIFYKPTSYIDPSNYWFAIKHYWQRCKYGTSELDMMDFDDHLMQELTRILPHYKNTSPFMLVINHLDTWDEAGEQAWDDEIDALVKIGTDFFEGEWEGNLPKREFFERVSVILPNMYNI